MPVSADDLEPVVSVLGHFIRGLAGLYIVVWRSGAVPQLGALHVVLEDGPRAPRTVGVAAACVGRSAVGVRSTGANTRTIRDGMNRVRHA